MNLVKTRGGFTALATVVLLTTSTSSHAKDLPFFNWFGNSVNAEFLNSLNHLTDANAATVQVALVEKPDGERIVVVPEELGDSGLAVFDNVKVDYVFADYELLVSTTKFKHLADAIGTSEMSSEARIGNFNPYPLFPDTTTPYTDLSNITVPSFLLSGTNLANERFYPNSPGFGGPASNNFDAPNLISALHTKPVSSPSLTSEGMARFPEDYKHIPYVTRFNKLGNDDDPNSEFLFKWASSWCIAATPSSRRARSCTAWLHSVTATSRRSRPNMEITSVRRAGVGPTHPAAGWD